MAVNGNISWDPAIGVNSYKVEYKLQADPTWTLYSAAVNTTSASIPGLKEGMAYDFRITSNCYTGTSSGVIKSGNSDCLNVNGLQATFVGTTANLQWTKKPDALSYTIEYKIQSSPTYTQAFNSPLNNTGQPDPVTFSIPGLSPGSAYDFKVTVNCVVGASSGAVASATSTCLNVTNLQVTFS